MQFSAQESQTSVPAVAMRHADSFFHRRTEPCGSVPYSPGLRYPGGSKFDYRPHVFEMVIVKSWIPIVLFALVLLATGHPSSILPPRVRQASSSIAPSSSPLLEPGFNAVARSAGKLYFGTATNNYQLNDTAYVTILDDLAMFGQITPAKVMKWVRTPPFPLYLQMKV